MPAFGTILLLIEYGFRRAAAWLILRLFPAILLDEHTSIPNDGADVE
jgi:hypothetical protein